MLGYDDKVSDHPVSEAILQVPEICLEAPFPLFAKMEEDQVKELDALLQKRVADANRKKEKIPVVIV